jgi:hypothetical protein
MFWKGRGSSTLEGLLWGAGSGDRTRRVCSQPLVGVQETLEIWSVKAQAACGHQPCREQEQHLNEEQGPADWGPLEVTVAARVRAQPSVLWRRGSVCLPGGPPAVMDHTSKALYEAGRLARPSHPPERHMAGQGTWLPCLGHSGFGNQSCRPRVGRACGMTPCITPQVWAAPGQSHV